MRIAILGPGRLGRSLLPLLTEAGHEPVIWCRGVPLPTAEVFWITVSDGAIGEVAALLPQGSLVLHASGSQDIEVLRPHSPAGSLHLLTSFPGPEVAIPPLEGVPAALSGDPPALEAARQIATSLGMTPFEIRGDRRLYHAAAVLAGNFTTLLVDAASSLLGAVGVEEEQGAAFLAPLMLASIQQSVDRGPLDALTGPLARGDSETVAGHLHALREQHPETATLYCALARHGINRLREKGRLSPEECGALIRIMDDPSSSSGS